MIRGRVSAWTGLSRFHGLLVTGLAVGCSSGVPEEGAPSMTCSSGGCDGSSGGTGGGQTGAGGDGQTGAGGGGQTGIGGGPTGGIGGGPTGGIGGGPTGGVGAGGTLVNPACPGETTVAYQGAPAVVPGTVEAEDFDLGGYSDTSTGNEGGAYRTDVDVDIKALGAGYAIGWMMAAEWLEYTVDVPRAGDYTLSVRAGALEAGRTLEFSECGTALTGPVAIPQIAAWGEMATATAGTVHLEAGLQVIRVTVGPNDFVDLDSLSLQPAAAGTGGTGGSAGTGGAAGAGGASGAGGSGGTHASVFHVFLLIGQSNMAGGAETEPQDLVEDPRIKVLGYDDCAQTGRTYNEWDAAAPPLHACWSNGIGPGDHFAKTLIRALPEGDTIGLVPCAIPGVDIDFFRKGVISARRGEFSIPPDNHWDSAYDWVIERARLAQSAGGTLDGIIFHQGESDSGQRVWLDKVKDMVDDLRADLGTGEMPFIAGELLHSGCCGGHNSLVNQLPDRISNTYVVSATGLNGVDAFHFDAPGVRTLGQRYGEAMIGALAQ